MLVAPQLVELCVRLPLSMLGFYLPGAYTGLMCGIKITGSSLVHVPFVPRKYCILDAVNHFPLFQPFHPSSSETPEPWGEEPETIV